MLKTHLNYLSISICTGTGTGKKQQNFNYLLLSMNGLKTDFVFWCSVGNLIGFFDIAKQL